MLTLKRRDGAKKEIVSGSESGLDCNAIDHVKGNDFTTYHHPNLSNFVDRSCLHFVIDGFWGLMPFLFSVLICCVYINSELVYVGCTWEEVTFERHGSVSALFIFPMSWCLHYFDVRMILRM